jgi:hypothetical protein
MARINRSVVPQVQIGGKSFAFSSQADLDKINEAIADLKPVKEEYRDGNYVYTVDTKAKPQRMMASLTFAWEDVGE